MADKMKWIYLLGLGYLLMESKGNHHYRNDEIPKYKSYTNKLYHITFEYPGNWVLNKNYESRYEGPEGFFEVAEINALGRDIDQVAQQEVDTPIQPYGANPQIKTLTLDGQPARLIIPSSDQNKVFDREVALIIKNKKPVIENGDAYNYTIIWSNAQALEHMIKTFKFL